MIGVVVIQDARLMVGVCGGFRTLSVLLHLLNQLLKKGSPGRTVTRGLKGRQGHTRNGLRGKVDYCICGPNLRIGLPSAAERLVDSNQVVDYLLIALRQ